MTHGYPLCAHTIATAIPVTEREKESSRLGEFWVRIETRAREEKYLRKGLNRLIKRHQSDQKPIQKCALNKQNVPVFPLVASTTVIPGFNFPLFSASSITANARRSFTDDKGLKYSHLTYTSTPSGANLFIFTIGVSPINEVMFSWTTAFGLRETLDVRLVVVVVLITFCGRFEMDWVNDNMVDLIDRLNWIVELFGPTVFS